MLRDDFTNATATGTPDSRNSTPATPTGTKTANRIATRSLIATCADGSHSLNQGLRLQEIELRGAFLSTPERWLLPTKRSMTETATMADHHPHDEPEYRATEKEECRTKERPRLLLKVGRRRRALDDGERSTQECATECREHRSCPDGGSTTFLIAPSVGALLA